MTLQQFIDFDQYVRCFTFGKTDITPVAYDPRERRYLVDHEYLSPELGARVVRDAQTINLALGYEMNTIEFAIEDGVPYAIDFLNPGARLRARSHHAVLLLARRREDGASSSSTARSTATRRSRWPRWEEMLGIGPRPDSPARPGRCSEWISSADVARAAAARRRAEPRRSAGASPRRMRERKLTFGDRVHCPFLRPFFLTGSDEARIRAAAETIAALGERVAAGGDGLAGAARPARADRAGDRPGRDRSGLRDARAPPPGSTRSCCPTRCTSPSTTPNRRRASATPSGWRSSSTRCR